MPWSPWHWVEHSKPPGPNSNYGQCMKCLEIRFCILNFISSPSHSGSNQEKIVTANSDYNFACNLCNDFSKTIRGVRVHYITNHAWNNYEYSPIMQQPHKNISNLCTVSKGRFKCSCGQKSSIRLLQEEDFDCLGRQWILLHRLVDPPHFNEKTEKTRGMKTFPTDLIVNISDKNRTESEKEEEDDDDSLPDISKYARPLADKHKENLSISEFDTSEDGDLFIPDKAVAKVDKKSKDNEFKAKKVRTKDTKAFMALKRRAKEEAINYQIELKSQSLDSYTFEAKNKKNSSKYVIVFGETSVTCNCPAFKEIELRRWETSNQVCKHVAIVTIYCHQNLQESYKGQRFFSTRSTFMNLKEMFKSFDPERNLQERKRHANFFLYPPPIPNPIKTFPYFSKKQDALNLLSKIATPQWFAEKYNRETNQGDKPTCKSCSKKFELGKLCLRLDYTHVFQNRNYKKDEFTLTTSPFRICVKLACFTDINTKIRTKANYCSRSNLHGIDQVDLAHVFDQDKVTVKRTIKNNVTFLNE